MVNLSSFRQELRAAISSRADHEAPTVQALHVIEHRLSGPFRHRLGKAKSFSVHTRDEILKVAERPKADVDHFVMVDLKQISAIIFGAGAYIESSTLRF